MALILKLLENVLFFETRHLLQKVWQLKQQINATYNIFLTPLFNNENQATVTVTVKLSLG